MMIAPSTFACSIAGLAFFALSMAHVVSAFVQHGHHRHYCLHIPTAAIKEDNNIGQRHHLKTHLWMMPVAVPVLETTMPPSSSTTITSTVTQSSPLLISTSPSILDYSTKQWLSTSTSSSTTTTLASMMIADAQQQSQSPPPTAAEIKLLREAFASFYGTQRDPPRALELFNQVVEAWQRQPPDELAGIYRVRGDVFMANLDANSAIQDYTKAIELLKNDAERPQPKADPTEFTASFLGRGRAIRTLGVTATSEQRQMAVDDYKQALLRSAKEDPDYYDSQQEQIEDGGRTNPYAVWEYGMALRLNGRLSDARDIHLFAAECFKDIGDSARSVQSKIDAGIDAAGAVSASSSSSKDDFVAAEELLKDGIQSTTKVEGRDVPLLQRVIAKEGEGRMALAALQWSTAGQKSDAETQLTAVCSRLDQLEADALARQRVNPQPQTPPRLLFSIDDQPGALETSCTKLKQPSFLNDRLEWPNGLQQKVDKLLKVK